MPKMKPHKGLRKRVTVTARKKLMRDVAGAGHLLSAKPGRRRQRLRKRVPILTKIAKNCLRALCAE